MPSTRSANKHATLKDASVETLEEWTDRVDSGEVSHKEHLTVLHEVADHLCGVFTAIKQRPDHEIIPLDQLGDKLVQVGQHPTSTTVIKKWVLTNKNFSLSKRFLDIEGTAGLFELMTALCSGMLNEYGRLKGPGCGRRPQELNELERKVQGLWSRVDQLGDRLGVRSLY